MRIGVIGGSGPAGSSLAALLASVGDEPIIGSRSTDRAMENRGAFVDRFPQLHEQLGDVDNAAESDIVVIAISWDSAATIAQDRHHPVRGKIAVSMANARIGVGREFPPRLPPRCSVAAHVQAAVPDSRVVAAFPNCPPPNWATWVIRSTPTCSSAVTTPRRSRRS